MRQVGLCFLILTILSSTFGGAADGKDYAYLFIQGRVGETYENRPMEGVTLRLTADSRVFETTTDHRGVFVFEKLPVTSFDLELETADGRVARGMWETSLGERDRARVRIKLGRGTGDRIRLEANQERFRVTVPPPPTRWSKLWAELGIFVGAAAALAL